MEIALTLENTPPYTYDRTEFQSVRRQVGRSTRIGTERETTTGVQLAF